MTTFNELNLEKVQLLQGNKVSIAPVITMNDEIIESTSEKKIGKEWDRFARRFGVDSKNGDYIVADDLTINESEEEVFSDGKYEHVYFTDLDSLASLNERERSNVTIGLRMIDDNTQEVIPFGEKIAVLVNKQTLDKDIGFDEIGDIYDDVIRELKKIVEEQRHALVLKQEEEEKQAKLKKEEEERKAEEERKRKEEEEKKKEKEINLDIEKDVDVQPLDDIGILKQSLREAIENAIPQVEISQIAEEKLLPNGVKGESYADIKKLSSESLSAKEKRQIERLKVIRKEKVETLYRELLAEVMERYTKNERILKIDAPESELHADFMKVKTKMESVINSLGAEKDKKTVELTDEYNAQKAAYVENARLEAEAFYEKEHKPKIQLKAVEFIEKLEKDNFNLYKEEVQKIEKTAKSTHNERFYQIVNETIKNNHDEINEQAQAVTSEIEQAALILLDEGEKEIARLQQQIAQIEKERIQNDQNFNERLEIRIREETQDIQNMKATINQIQDENLTLKSYLNRKEEDVKSREAELQGERERNELIRKELEELKRINAEKDAQLIEAHKKISDVHVDSIQRLSSVYPATADVEGDDELKDTKRKIFYRKANGKSIWSWLLPLLSVLLLATVILVSAFMISENLHNNTFKNDTPTEQSVEASNGQSATNSEHKVGDTITVEWSKNNNVEATVKSVEKDKVTVEYNGEERVLE